MANRWSSILWITGYVDSINSLICPSTAPNKWPANIKLEYGNDFLLQAQKVYGMPRRTGVWPKTLEAEGSLTYVDHSWYTLNFGKMKQMRPILVDTYNPTTKYQVAEWDPKNTYSGGASANCIGAVHSSRANVGWSDGHVESLKLRELKDRCEDLIVGYGPAVSLTLARTIQ